MLAEPLISPDWTFALWGVMLGLAAFAFWAETTKLGRTVSGVALAMIVAHDLVQRKPDPQVSSSL